jgi:chemotaxis protein methyltransferase CheR
MNKSDIIFCANVLIYFDAQSKIKVIDNLYNNLNPNGYLFIGYSETLHGISKAFKLVSFPRTIGYKKG